MKTDKNNIVSILPSENIRTALKQLSIGGTKCLVVVNKQNTILGTISDGDIRRAILKKKKITSKITNTFNKKPFVLLDTNYDKNKIRNFFLKNKIDIIPIVNFKKKLVRVITWNDVFKLPKRTQIDNNLQTIIMAGGKGTRMKPFTNILPKPLIPVNGKTAIEVIIENFESYGILNSLVSINEKSEIIKSYFKEAQTKHKLKFVEEKKPLGTIGSLSLTI